MIVNRTSSKAKGLARHLGCEWSEKIPAYDILVNATSVTMPVKAEEIQAEKWSWTLLSMRQGFSKQPVKKTADALMASRCTFSRRLLSRLFGLPIFCRKSSKGVIRTSSPRSDAIRYSQCTVFKLFGVSGGGGINVSTSPLQNSLMRQPTFKAR